MNCKPANTSFSPSVHASTSLSIRLGEDFINQQSTAFDTRFKFTGKEKNLETGYSYPSTGSGRRFGARYYDSDLSVWLSVDPMADKHPNFTPFAYVYQNPMNLVDPFGEDSIQLNRDGHTNVIAKTNDKFDVFVATDKDGNLDRSKTHNIDKKDYKKKTSTCEQNDGSNGDYDLYEARGDDKSTDLFEFFANNTDVEWSHGRFGNSGNRALNVLTTSFDESSEAGMSHALVKRFLYGYNIRELTHNHPSGNGRPSGENGDIGFLKQVNSFYRWNNEIKFQIFSNENGKRYSPYSKYGTLDLDYLILDYVDSHAH